MDERNKHNNVNKFREILGTVLTTIFEIVILVLKNLDSRIKLLILGIGAGIIISVLSDCVSRYIHRMRQNKHQYMEWRERTEQKEDYCSDWDEAEEIKKRLRIKRNKFENGCTNIKRKFTIKIAVFLIMLCVNVIMIFFVYQEITLLEIEKENGESVTNNQNSNESVNISEIENNNSNSNTFKLGNDEEDALKLEDIESVQVVLLERDKVICLSTEEEKAIFYIISDKEISSDSVKNHLKQILDLNIKNGLEDESEIVKDISATASAKGDIFYTKIDEAARYKNIGDMESWKVTVPDSGFLEKEVMQPREKLWEERKSNQEICFGLANNNKCLADEYMRQKGNYETVIYYFGQSILWTERGLAYEDLTDRNKKIYYNFLKARYKDIGDYIEKNYDNMNDKEKKRFDVIRKKAITIYSAMSEIVE